MSKKPFWHSVHEQTHTHTHTLAHLKHGNKNILLVQVIYSRVANLKERNPLEILGVDGNIILKWILKEQDKKLNRIHLNHIRA